MSIRQNLFVMIVLVIEMKPNIVMLILSEEDKDILLGVIADKMQWLKLQNSGNCYMLRDPKGIRD